MKIYPVAAALALASIGVAPDAFAGSAAPTYGAFVEGAIGNNPFGSPTTQGVQCGGVCYYFGTNYVTGSGAYSEASGAVGTPGSWGYASATADLASGLITVTASSSGNPPYQSNPLPFGSPAGATAGFFTEIEFTGPGSGGMVAVTMSGTALDSGNASLTEAIDLNTCCLFGGGSPIAVSGGTWSVTDNFSVVYDQPYFLSAYLSVSTSGSFLPGSATVTDPFSIDVPSDVTYTAAAPQFLQTAAGVPEPATWALMLVGFLGIGMTQRSRRRLIDVRASGRMRAANFPSSP